MKAWIGIDEFVQVAETGSLTAAAKQLGISVAQVSRNIATLEQRLGIQLLYRTTRRTRLTDEGQLYLPHCQHLLQGREEADLAVMARREQPQGLLRITAPVFYGEQVLSPFLSIFLRRYPDCQVDVKLSNDTLNLLEQHVDVAIRLGQLGNPRLHARKLGSRHHYLVGAPSYFAQYGRPSSIEDLQQHACLTGSINHWRFQANGEIIRWQPQQRLQARLQANSGVVLVNAAKQGVGLALLPDYYVVEAIKQGELDEVLADYRQPDDGIWALYPESRQRLPKVRVFIDELHEYLNG
ncbi:LysR family transcriptional regulator [Idiomarina tyrosinivorans]|uniref:LysR family transcriptional regulator n=1 Tax=Idiomarina tyrosinivorans TaxID=1445662 RepID=A0A432ZLT8_9GAMM|nr:LysR family transcriptional regulator [Idiomarina tyrosinivorans]RUO78830.1 LysR family transcriptional regulator [Idiomarina tyrosinivorans]